ncbi:MAG: DNRLRE domain-containing protein [Bacteroidetes bacterium]|nr:DNRLRE domain-containing protein [Bacteroidota bacterium]
MVYFTFFPSPEAVPVDITKKEDRIIVRISIVLSSILLLLTACQNDPDPTGIGLVPGGDVVTAERFDSQTDSSEIRADTYVFRANHAGTTVLSVGEAEGIRSTTLLRWLYFNVDSSLAYGGRIVSATVRLRSMPYHVGDINAPFSMELHEITSFWNAFTVTADSLNQGSPTTGAVAGMFQGTFGETDSIDIPIDTALVRRWMHNSFEVDYASNHGLMLQTAAAQSGIIRSFQSLDPSNASPPRLTVIIENAGVLDTIVGESADNTTLCDGPLHENAGRIVLQSGISIRGRLIFDMSAIPAASIINHATLYLSRDDALSTKYYRGADSVLVYESVDSIANTLNSTGVITRTDSELPGVLIAEGVPVTRAVQNWVNRKGNHGFILVPMYELSDIDRMALYGADAPADKRPRLVVTYTTKPDLP